MSVPGIFKNNPFQDPTKDWKELLNSNKEVLRIIAEFTHDIKPWMKVFLGSAAWMMFWSGVAIANAFFNGIFGG